MLPERIEFSEDPRLDAFRSLKAQNVIRDGRLFVAEGPTVVERVLRSEFEVRLPTDIPVYRLRNELAEELVGFAFHCGVLASVVRRPALPVAAWLPSTGPALVVAGDRITDPENVGALVRIASAFGAAAVVLSHGSADPFSRRVLRVSMGNVLFLPVIETEDLPGYLAALSQDHSCSLCSTVLDPTATALSTFHFAPRTALLFGNEYDGVSTEARSISSQPLTIPMLNGTDSLNVAVSAGIFLHQFRSQWPTG